MPDFFPFPGLRYAPHAVGARLDDLTAPPYDVIDAEGLARLEAADPHNAVHLILPRDREPGDRYRQAARRLDEWQRRGVLVADPPCLYLYRMRFTDDAGVVRTTTGVVGALALSPPGAGAVLPHERTMPKPRGDRLELLRATRANLDPVWCLSLAPGLSDLLGGDLPPGSACVDGDGVEHCVAPLPDSAVGPVSEMVAAAPVVIADGHHRYETALAFAEESPPPGAQRIMALVVELAPEQLCVRAIHRLVLGAAGFRSRLGPVATLTPTGPVTPEGLRELLDRMDAEGAMGLVDGDGLALLHLRPERLGPGLERLPAPLRGVDAARLEVALAQIGEPEALEFHHDPAVVAATVAKGTADAGVLLRPVSVPQIQAVAAAGERMPEKTTFFTPKPLTGMVFRRLD